MSRSLNKAMIIGHVADEPVVRGFANGGKVANISVATNEWTRGAPDANGNFSSQGSETTEWHRISIWGRLAEVAEKYVHKGTRVYIEGKLRTRSYVDKSNIKRYSTEIVADNLLLLDSRSNASNNDPNYQQSQPYGNNQSMGGNRNWGGEFEGNFGSYNPGGQAPMGQGTAPVNNYQQGNQYQNAPYQNGGQFQDYGTQPPAQNNHQNWAEPRNYTSDGNSFDGNQQMGSFGGNTMQGGMNNVPSYNNQPPMAGDASSNAGGFNKGIYANSQPRQGMDAGNGAPPVADNKADDDIPF